MPSHEHISAEPVRSYLLGMLEESSAASLEERYFTDRRFFLFVQEVETALIEDYIADRLAPPIKSCFEARYLSVPELRRRLEEVRGRPRRRPSVMVQLYRSRPLMVAAVLLVCVGIAAFWLYRGRMKVELLPTSTGARPVLATLSLSPGLLKGEGVEAPRLALPSRQGTVRLELELPGQTQVLGSTRVSLSSPGGAWRRIWSSSQPVWSRTAAIAVATAPATSCW